MPIENGVGYGDLTQLKIEHLSRIMAMHWAVTKAVLNKHTAFKQRYRYIDLTSGKGRTPDGLLGSPLVFLDQLKSDGFSKPFQADFIECNEQNMRELQAAIDNFGLTSSGILQNIQFHQGDYEQVVPRLIRGLDKKELGLVFVDPSGDAPNFDVLKQLAELRPRMEILIYVSTTNIKRVHHLTDKLLSDHMKTVGKTYWLIRKPIPWDSHKWTFLLGSNTDIFKNYRRIDFLRIESDEAQDFFPFLNLTTQQRIQRIQPGLPGILDES